MVKNEEKYSKLKEVIKERFGENAKVIKVNQSIVLIKFNKGDSLQYATLAHNNNDVFWGHYYMIHSDGDESATRNEAIADYHKRSEEII